MEYFIIVLVCYLFGTISPAMLSGKIVSGIDIREVGSKNAGASNVTMTLGWKYGVLVGVSDILKGVIPVVILRFIYPDDAMWFLGGVSAVAGHIWPFYLKFRGGKGTATFIGVLLGGAPLIGFILGTLIILVTIASDYIALGTLSLMILAPFALWYFNYEPLTIYIVLGFSIVSFYKHIPNFIKIAKRQEPGLRGTFQKKDSV